MNGPAEEPCMDAGRGATRVWHKQGGFWFAGYPKVLSAGFCCGAAAAWIKMKSVWVDDDGQANE